MHSRLRHASRHYHQASRPLLYLAFFLTLFFLLFWWNSWPESGEEVGQQQIIERVVFKKVEDGEAALSGDRSGGGGREKFEAEKSTAFKGVEHHQQQNHRPPLPHHPPLMPVAPPPLHPKKKAANVVHLTVYMEAQCPDTTGFIRRHLLPSWSRLGSTKRINVTIVPFGKASCVREPDDDYKCECQHGKDECELNQLMNCAIEHMPHPDSHIPLIGCVQGKDNLIAAFRSCLNGHSSSDLLWSCSIGKRGRHLHAISGNKTASIGDEFNFVPWVVLDGHRENDAFYALEENLCKRMEEPKPAHCKKLSP